MSIVRYGAVAVVVLSYCGWVPIAGAAQRGQDTKARSSDASEDRHAEPAKHAAMVRIERQYRHRLARLNRLRELAEQEDASDRLAELDELHDRLRGHRNKAREQYETRRERRADLRETHRSRRQIRGSARDRAEQRWLDARRATAVKVQAPTHMKHAASRLARKRWREEARDHGAARRWERAARRSGMLDDVRPLSVSPRHGQRGGVADISQDDADRAFERLRREIGARE